MKLNLISSLIFDYAIKTKLIINVLFKNENENFMQIFFKKRILLNINKLVLLVVGATLISVPSRVSVVCLPYLVKYDQIWHNVSIKVFPRIMVDVAYFRKINPNYTRPHINELARPSSSNNYIFLFSDTDVKEAKTNGLDTKTMSEGDLMICSQTVYGWSFGNKRWRKFSSPEFFTRWSLC